MIKNIGIVLLLLTICYQSIWSQEIQFTSSPENLGPNVNTHLAETVPVIAPDGSYMTFSRKGDPLNYGGDEIWISFIRKDGSFSPAIHIEKPLNNQGHNFVQSISSDGNAWLLANVYNYHSGSMEEGVSISYYKEDNWGYPMKQDIDNYKNKSDYAAYFLAPDNKTLIMAIEGKKSRGYRDIYVSFQQGVNKWSEPLNLGKTINTKKEEGSMFLASDNRTLYFSSYRLGGHGSSDIWMSKRLDSTWVNWSEPINMGPKINSANYESAFSISAAGDYAYFTSSNNSYGGSDIFRIKLPEEVQPDPVVLVKGKVLNAKTKQAISADIIYENLSDGKEMGIARSAPGNGDYKLVLPYGKKYGMAASVEGYYSVSENIDLSEMSEYAVVEKDLLLAPIEVGEVVRLNNIFFEVAKSELKEESFSELDRVVQLLTTSPSVTIQISGHTDNIGLEENNLQLSDNRSKAVVDYLVSKGISAGRLSFKGCGESSPVTTNDTEEGRAFNRRVEFKVISK